MAVFNYDLIDKLQIGNLWSIHGSCLRSSKNCGHVGYYLVGSGAKPMWDPINKGKSTVLPCNEG